jgi:molybdopterin-biosynthesis enzyme MoeA-like protein
MEAMFLALEDGLRAEQPIGSWRRRYATRESHIVGVLVEVGERYPDIIVGSYPTFSGGASEVEVVVKSRDEDELAAAVAWLEPELERAIG